MGEKTTGRNEERNGEDEGRRYDGITEREREDEEEERRGEGERVQAGEIAVD